LVDDEAVGLGPKYVMVRSERGLTFKNKGSSYGRAVTRRSEPLRLGAKIAPKE
jgi:hypothetical protein